MSDQERRAPHQVPAHAKLEDAHPACSGAAPDAERKDRITTATSFPDRRQPGQPAPAEACRSPQGPASFRPGPGEGASFQRSRHGLFACWEHTREISAHTGEGLNPGSSGLVGGATPVSLPRLLHAHFAQRALPMGAGRAPSGRQPVGARSQGERGLRSGRRLPHSYARLLTWWAASAGGRIGPEPPRGFVGRRASLYTSSTPWACPSEGAPRMKVTCLQENLARGLSIAARAVARAARCLCSAMCWWRRIMAVCACRRPTWRWASVAGWAPRSRMRAPPPCRQRTFVDLVNTLPNDHVQMDLTVRTQTLHVVCGAFNNDIKCLDAQEFPPLPPPTWTTGSRSTSPTSKR